MKAKESDGYYIAELQNEILQLKSRIAGLRNLKTEKDRVLWSVYGGQKRAAQRLQRIDAQFATLIDLLKEERAFIKRHRIALMPPDHPDDINPSS